MKLLPRLRIVSINDVYELHNLPKLQTFLSRARPRPDAIVLAGDFLSPSTLSSLDGGKGMVSTLRSVGLTHVVLGNHEADLKLPQLRRRLQELRRGNSNSRRRITILNSNIQSTPKAPWLMNPNENDDDEEEGSHLNNTNTNNSSSSSSIDKGDGADPSQQYLTQRYSVVETRCRAKRIGLIGLMSDEAGIFRDDTFKGAPIANVLDAYDRMYDVINGHHHNHRNRSNSTRIPIVPITHQTIQRDKELAYHMLLRQQEQEEQEQQHSAFRTNSIIIGGHDHDQMYERIRLECSDDKEQQPQQQDSSSYVDIAKAGMDCWACNVIDLTFDNNDDDNRIVDIEYRLEHLASYEPSVVVQSIVDKHMSLLSAMENETIIDSRHLLQPGQRLSSKGTRVRQTTVGAILCQAIKDELENVDVCVLNGAPIKGDAVYDDGCIKYAQLKKELPFPTKIVVVPMKRWQLQIAINYSRTQEPAGPGTSRDGPPAVPRRGYLQTDLEYDRMESQFHLTCGMEDDLMVALPRNLLKGFCNNEPLMKIGERLVAENKFPADDDFVPAIDLVVRHFCKERWYDKIMDSDLTFDDLDIDGNGVLTRDEIASFFSHRKFKQWRIRASAKNKEKGASDTTGNDGNDKDKDSSENDDDGEDDDDETIAIPDFVLDDMIAAIDLDKNGVIDRGEFSLLLAQMEREHGSFF